MTEERPNPLASHLMSLVEGRQQAEVAKIALLHEISRKAGEIVAELKSANVHLDELLERARAKSRGVG